VAELAATPPLMPTLEPPPPRWRDWGEVRRVGEDLRVHRTLFLHRTDDLTREEHQTLDELLAGPVEANFASPVRSSTHGSLSGKTTADSAALQLTLSSITSCGGLILRRPHWRRCTDNCSTWISTTSGG